MTFTADWLALREPADHVARDQTLLAAAGRWLSDRGPAPQIVDLGCGTGSNLRALTPVAPAEARWRLVDYDAALLAAATTTRDDVEAVRLDLSAPEVWSSARPLEGADLVTAAALIDLVSEDWLARLVAATPSNAAIYIALTYDGRETWRPAHPDDDAAHAAIHAHQRGDKGFGPALGPEAAPRLAELLSARGYATTLRPSPWRLVRAEHGALIDALADGYAGAAAEMGVDVSAWSAIRRDAAEIGHWDLFATPS